MSMEVLVETSARHLHVTQEHLEILFGKGYELTKKKDLSTMAGISPATITKMGKNGHVTTEVLLKVCTALNCQMEDIIEIIPENEKGVKV